MKRSPAIYIASKLELAEAIKALQFSYPDIRFTARWPYYIGSIPDTAVFAKHFWEDDFQDILSADALILFGRAKDKLRGALVEVGFALANAKPVFVVGDHQDYGTWQYHRLVIQVKTVRQAVEYIRQHKHQFV